MDFDHADKDTVLISLSIDLIAQMGKDLVNPDKYDSDGINVQASLDGLSFIDKFDLKSKLKVSLSLRNR